MEIVEQVGNIDSVVTDPPYGMNFVSNYRKQKYEKIKNDDGFVFLNWACNLNARHSKYVFCRWDNLFHVPQPKSYITWVKNNHSMGDLRHEHARQTEGILFYNGDDHQWSSQRPNDVIQCPRTENGLHPTEKPVGLMQVICGWTNGVIFDPFMGSGTTLVAAAKMGKKAIGVEIEQKYFDIACKRVEEAYKQEDLFYGKN